MAKTLFFYDVETSGTNPAYQRIMQFAGQRTDLDLKPIGEPVNWLVRLSEDVLPEPEAILVHGISPQKTIAEGISEAEFSRHLTDEIFKPDTIALGFNTIRFDDEFVRFTLWRNFRDPYAWHWADGRGRWDLMDATRMMRALRPDGLSWPLDAEGKPTNRLSELAAANAIELSNAHDALADVNATIEWARLMRGAQPKLFGYLFGLRDKRSVEQVVSEAKPFVYTSGRYSGEYLKTTAVIMLANHPSESNAVLVYDLRVNPEPYLKMSVKELAQRIYVPYVERDTTPPLPVKRLALNKAPAVAPLNTLDKASMRRIGLSADAVDANLAKLRKAEGFVEHVSEAFAGQKPSKRTDPDGQLYDGFLNDQDKRLVGEVSSAEPAELAELAPSFADERLDQLLLRYKARNFPEILSAQEQAQWENWRQQKLIKGVDNSLTLSLFGQRLAQRAAIPGLDDKQKFLLEETRLWAESIAPASLF
jgi:exodeoxyribonuclease-1